jgi:hypothetical protein
MKKYFALAMLALLTACEQAPAPQTLPGVNFSGATPIRLAVAEIRVIDNYRPKLAAPNVEHQFPLTPAQAIKDWASQRLQATGGTGILEITIEDASVVEVPLPVKEGVRGFFSDDQSQRYDLKLRTVMRAYSGERASADAEGDVNIVRSKSINEKATIADREALFNTMVLEAATIHDREAEARLRQFFNRFIR